ncbi:MAG: hypothetical protein V2A72_08155 [Candidatus Omnitrophota bacterium]
MSRDERIQIRLTKESKEFLEQLAESEDRSLSQMAARIINSHLELLVKMGQMFHNDYVRLIKSHKAEEIAQAFKRLSECDECIDEQIKMKEMKRKIKDGT